MIIPLAYSPVYLKKAIFHGKVHGKVWALASKEIAEYMRPTK